MAYAAFSHTEAIDDVVELFADSATFHDCGDVIRVVFRAIDERGRHLTVSRIVMSRRAFREGACRAATV